jgi:hypothetical protein
VIELPARAAATEWVLPLPRRTQDFEAAPGFPKHRVNPRALAMTSTRGIDRWEITGARRVTWTAAIRA